jgi:hypothetical protein
MTAPTHARHSHAVKAGRLVGLADLGIERLLALWGMAGSRPKSG